MVGSITAACVLFSLSRSLCVPRRRRVKKLVFKTLALVFLCLVFARVEWWFEWDRQTRRHFPAEELMWCRRVYKAHRTTTVHNARDSKEEERDDDDESISFVSFFFRKTRVHSILYYCLFFFVRIRIRIRRLKMSRLERRNECSLQSRKNSTRTSTREAWWT